MLTVRNIADTRPSIAPGVTVWRSVVEVMVQMIGPKPKRKNDAPASAPRGQASVATIVAMAATDTSGPSRIAWPKLRRATMRGASSAPATMPLP